MDFIVLEDQINSVNFECNGTDQILNLRFAVDPVDPLKIYSACAFDTASGSTSPYVEIAAGANFFNAFTGELTQGYSLDLGLKLLSNSYLGTRPPSVWPLSAGTYGMGAALSGFLDRDASTNFAVSYGIAYEGGPARASTTVFVGSSSSVTSVDLVSVVADSGSARALVTFVDDTSGFEVMMAQLYEYPSTAGGAMSAVGGAMVISVTGTDAYQPSAFLLPSGEALVSYSEFGGGLWGRRLNLATGSLSNRITLINSISAPNFIALSDTHFAMVGVRSSTEALVRVYNAADMTPATAALVIGMGTRQLSAARRGNDSFVVGGSDSSGILSMAVCIVDGGTVRLSGATVGSPLNHTFDSAAQLDAGLQWDPDVLQVMVDSSGARALFFAMFTGSSTTSAVSYTLPVQLLPVDGRSIYRNDSVATCAGPVMYVEGYSPFCCPANTYVGELEVIDSSNRLVTVQGCVSCSFNISKCCVGEMEFMDPLTFECLACDGIVSDDGFECSPFPARGNSESGGGDGGILGIALGSSLGGFVIACCILCCAFCLCLCCLLLLLALLVLTVVVTAILVVAALSSVGFLIVRRATKRAKKVYDLAAFAGYEGEEVHDGLQREFRELKFEDLTFDKKVGEGAFGRVFLGYWRDSTIVAIKELNVQADDKAKREFIHEANVMAQVGNHPNVVHFIGAVTTEERYYMVTEFAQNGSLLDVLVRKAGHRLDEPTLLGFARDAAAGIAHLHAEGIVHRDIAARNFLVSKDMTVQVADFGLSRIVEATEGRDAMAQRTQSNIGPVRWMAPESLRAHEYSTASDVYMFGMFLFELATGGMPFEDLNVHEVLQAVVERRERPSIPPHAHPLLVSCMAECWAHEPRERPSIKSIQRRLDPDGSASASRSVATGQLDDHSENVVDLGYVQTDF